MVGKKFFSIVSMVGFALALLYGSAMAQLSKDEQKCLDCYNNKGRLVGQQAGKDYRKCVKDAGKGKLVGTADDCVTNDTPGKIAGKQAKVTDCYNSGKCTGGEPIQQGAAAMNTAMVDSSQDLVRDIFGDPISGVTTPGKDEAKCQDKAYKDAEKLFTEKLKTFRKCKKDGMKSGAITDSASLETECMNDPQPFAIPDPKGKQAKKLQKLVDDVNKKCTGLSFSSIFPGQCAGSGNNAALTSCIDQLVECRVCEALNAADGMSVDCDLFDDGMANGSCPPVPPIGTHKCVFDGSSTVTVISQALPLAPFAAGGAIDITCGSIDGGTGKATCTCSLQDFDPLNIVSIGYVCFTPGSPCPSGEIDCDGGNALDVDMESDHNIGSCTSNADCATQCDSYCSGLSLNYYFSACEGFCQGGANDGMSCGADSDCPDGSCPGKDQPNQHTNVCGCDCQDIGGGASGAGALQCNLPVNINVESNPPCGDGDVLIAVGTRCIPLTSESITAQIHNTNNTAAKDFPMPAFTDSGTGIDCGTLSGSVTTGLNMVGAVNFFDSTIGDLQSSQSFTCQ